MVLVSREDANAYCRWLTDTERAAGRLLPGQLYRLPSDREWSAAMGVLNEPGEFPEDRSFPDDIYSWPTGAEPPHNAENLKWDNDDFTFTAPVGSGGANRFGLYDLMGNVGEICADPWGITDGHGAAAVIRGRDYHNSRDSERYRIRDVHAGARQVGVPTAGFRCVLDLKTESQQAIQIAIEETVGKLQALAAEANIPRREINALVNDEMVMLDLRRSRGLSEEISVRLQGLPLTRFMATWSDTKGTFPALKSFSLQAACLHLEWSDDPSAVFENLRGQPLTHLNLTQHPDFGMKAKDINFLEGAPLSQLHLWNFSNLENIEPLRGLPLETVHFVGYMPEKLDLSPIKDVPIRRIVLPSSISLDVLLSASDWWGETVEEAYGTIGGKHTFQSLFGRYLSEAALTGDPAKVANIKTILTAKLNNQPAFGDALYELDTDRFNQLVEFHTRAARLVSGDASSFDGEYLTFDGHAYLWCDQKLNFDAAQIFADALGGHLVTITTEAENDFVFERLASSPNQSNYWLGLNRTGAGRQGLVWVTGEAQGYHGWQEPGDGSHKDRACLRVNRGKSSWEEAWKESQMFFIIEWDTPTPQPPASPR